MKKTASAALCATGFVRLLLRSCVPAPLREIPRADASNSFKSCETSSSKSFEKPADKSFNHTTKISHFAIFF